MTVSETKSPGWMRAVQIGLGIMTLVLSGYSSCFSCNDVCHHRVHFRDSFTYSGNRTESSVAYLNATPGASRWGSVGLGILVIIIALIVMAYPTGTGVFLLILLAIALLFDGIARVWHGFSHRGAGKGSRIFLIIAGVIEIGLSIAIFASPVVGAVFIGILLAIALIIVGIQIIFAGITGSRFSIRK